MAACRALVVDDDAALVEALVANLTKLGVAAVGCTNRVAAIEYLGRNSPAILIVDVKLPDGDGVELTRHPGVSGACVFVITGVADSRLALRCQQNHAHLFIKSGHLWKQMEPVLRQHLSRAA
jgi:two-component system response regulator PilR (NtrC family)